MAQIYYYDPQSAGINVQSPQSESTPRRLTYTFTQNNGAEIFEFGSFQQFHKLSEKLQWSKNKLYNTLG